MRTEDFNDQVIEQLREKAQALAGLRHNHGVVRGNCVSSDKRFKTTVYGRDNDEIKDLYERIMPVIVERFEPNNLSYTSGPRRVSITKRTRSLAGTPSPLRWLQLSVSGWSLQSSVACEWHREPCSALSSTVGCLCWGALYPCALSSI